VIGLTVGITATIVVRFPISNLRVQAAIYGFVATSVAIILLNSAYLRFPFVYLVLALMVAFPLFLLAGHRDIVVVAESLGWHWSWRWGLLGFGVGVASAALDALSYYYGSSLNRFVGISLTVGIPGLLVGVIAGGIHKRAVIEMRIKPNQGIRQTG